MGRYETTLPFPRGSTHSDASTGATMSDTTFSDLEGRIYESVDTEHDTGKTVYLCVVKNDTSAAITAANRPMRWATNALDIGRRIAGFCSTQGERAKPLDDAYAAGFSIPDNDLFYVVWEGPCSVQTEATSVSLSAGDQVTVDSTGYLDGAAAAADDYVLGTLDADAATTSTDAVVHVSAGLGVTAGLS